MRRLSTTRLLEGAGALLIALHVWHDVFGFGGGAVDNAFGAWFMPAAFLGSAAALIARAVQMRSERVAWLLLGAGLSVYAAASISYSVADALGTAPAFPSFADALYLAFYPLALSGLVGLVRSRFTGLRAAVWLDGVVAGSAVAAAAAALVFQPVFDATIDGGAASTARFAYPVGDLICFGVVVTAWSLAGGRERRVWSVLCAAFALLAVADGLYVVQAGRGVWAQGSAADIPYVLATMVLSAAPWAARRRFAPARVGAEGDRLAVPVACGGVALVLAAYAAFAELNPLATVLSLIALLALVLRLATTFTRLNRHSSALAVIAATDPLTDLANHRAVHERLAEETLRATTLHTPLAVVALDLDHFKAINDTYGHTEGDTALQAVAGRLADQVRPGDLVGRIGGEEFVLVLPQTGPEEAMAIAERCRAAVSGLSVEGDKLACSAGVACYPADDENGARLLELADGALYWAKTSGRGQTRRYDPAEVVLLSSAEQGAQIRAVLASSDAIQPVFQPIVELATGRVAGYEALSRFSGVGPERGPSQWFAQARRCGLGPQLEAKAIRTALSIEGRPEGTFLSLNVSPASLLSPDVAAALPDDLSDIVIELTEDEMFTTSPALDAALDALRERGARIAVDDAGAGYAGLQQLIRIKPEILKLDRSLVSGVDADTSKRALLESFARFASTTGTAICGEGVETAAEMRMLTKVDMTYAQGFVLAAPGAVWPAVSATMAEEATAEVSAGMRLAPTAGPIRLGDVSETLVRIRSREDLDQAREPIARLLHADDVVVSRVRPELRAVETVSYTEQSPAGELFILDDYPTTEHVVAEQVIGQLIVGDPQADPAELRLLSASGHRALLLAPVVFRGTTVGLLELYRSAAQPWTRAEIDQARVLAHQLGAAIQGGLEPELPWTPDSVVSRSPKAGISEQAPRGEDRA
jgi:diguanylate cyclase (GGDEF)-like protein